MKKAKSSYSIRSIIQYSYFLMLLFVFVIFMGYFVISESDKLRKSTFQSMEQNVSTVSSYIENEISILNTVAQNVAYSDLIKERFSLYIDSFSVASPTSPSETYAWMENTKILTDLLTSIIGPRQPVSQIYLYSLDFGTFGIGHDNSASTASIKSQPWYEDFIKSSESYNVYCYPDNRLQKYYTGNSDIPFLSFCTMYYNRYNVPQGIIEIKNPLTTLTQRLDSLGSLYGEKIYVYDSAGRLIYPLSDADPGYYEMLDWKEEHLLADSIYSDTLENKDYLFYAHDNSAGFTSVVSVSEAQLRAPISNYIKVNLLIFMAVTILSFFLSFFVSKVITAPITNIHRQLRTFPSVIHNRHEIPAFPEVSTHIMELNTLYSALTAMQKKTIASMDREVALHNQEMQSRMLALQSQMNPHFLYNILSTVQSMADEGMNEEIITMCQTISRIQRYISSDKKSLIPLRDDLQYMKDYLVCMKLRFDDDLTYEIQIPDTMMDIELPKLCLQLIAENSIKYMTQSVPAPWKLQITGTLTATHWEIAIRDNGPGFTPESIRALEQQITSINETGLLPSLELNGMGLMNIYIRFKLMYKGNHIFKVNNHASGGAIVTIGGTFLD